MNELTAPRSIADRGVTRSWHKPDPGESPVTREEPTVFLMPELSTIQLRPSVVALPASYLLPKDPIMRYSVTDPKTCRHVRFERLAAVETTWKLRDLRRRKHQAWAIAVTTITGLGTVLLMLG